jgi:hypothetical protein
LEGVVTKPSNAPFAASCRVFATAVAGAILFAACATAPQKPPSGAPAPAPQLLSTGTLQLPQGCEPTHGTIYRTSFVVQPDGRVEGATSQAGDGCVQAALRAWVATFVYRAGGGATPVALDWMEVTAPREG